MTVGDGIAWMSTMALCAWIVWLKWGWPKPPFDKENNG